MAFRLSLVVLLILLSSPVYADEFRSKSNDGFDYYKNGEYDKAVEYYRQAGILRPEEVLPKIGKGASLYRSNDLDGATKEFESAASLGDKKVAADMYYNIGNTRYMSEDYKGAIESYINALRINPDELDYKQNLEIALSMLQEQEQQQQGQDGDEEGEQGDQGEKQNQEKGDQEQDQESKDQKAQDQQDQNQENKQDQQRMAEEGEMTQEEAENLLARFEEDEKEIQKQLKQVNIRGSSKNDW